jgi:hypothetical protein
MTKGDREALTLAMERTRAESLQRSEQIDDKLKDESWEDVATFAAYCARIESLKLKPWQQPPCHADEDDPNPRDPQAQALLKEMLSAGVSRYHPDPLAAIEAAKAGAAS